MLREKIRETLKSAKLLEEVEEGDVWALPISFLRAMASSL